MVSGLRTADHETCSVLPAPYHPCMMNATRPFSRFAWSLAVSLTLHASGLLLIGQTIREAAVNRLTSSLAPQSSHAPLLEVSIAPTGQQLILPLAHFGQDSIRHSLPILPSGPAMPSRKQTNGEKEPGSVLPMAPVIYVPANLLDVKPRIVRDIPSDFPELRDRREGGKLSLTLWIGAGGDVDRVSTSESDLPDLFIELATRAFYAAKFSPGKIRDTNIGTLLDIEVEFQSLGNAPPVSDQALSATGN